MGLCTNVSYAKVYSGALAVNLDVMITIRLGGVGVAARLWERRNYARRAPRRDDE